MRSATNSSAARNSVAAPKGALRELRGVGPKLEQQLVAEGFTSLRALATLRP